MKNINLISEVGGKGASLLKLKDYGFNVPSFFIITSKMFKSFIEFNKMEESIKEAVEDKNYETCQKLIKDGTFDINFTNWVLKEFKKLKTTQVSVRSSCSKEDGADKSYAGQFYTGLYVTEENIFEEIKNCFASLYNKYLVNYAEDIHNSFEMAVVIQKMIASEYSGVAFSTDFISTNKNTIIIEACKGIGENLVSGKTTPTKYFVRKEKRFIENFIGDNLPIEDYIIELAKTVEKIERKYKTPVDVEWAIADQQLYILQSRPIVGFIETKNEYRFNFSRPNMLGMVELDDIAERVGMKEIFNNFYYFKPLFKFNENHIFEVYYNISNIDEDPKCMINYILNNKDKYLKLMDKIYKKSNKLYSTLNNITKKNKNAIIEIYKYAGAFSNIVNFFDKTNVITDYSLGKDESFINTITAYREFFNDIAYKINDLIADISKKLLPDEYQKYSSVIMLDELISNNIDLEKLENRYQDGFIYFDGKLINNKNFENFLENEKISIIKEELKTNGDVISGLVAYPGKVKGKVKIIYTENDFDKVEDGDIIVSPMTTPTFISLMEKAAAIITDEGGTVCHAALIARELKKTCIVGTKTATQVLKDGMTIEVDGNTGKIKILN